MHDTTALCLRLVPAHASEHPPIPLMYHAPNSLSSHSLCQCAYLLSFKNMAILHGKIELKTLSAFAI